MNIDIKLHKDDLPEDLDLGNIKIGRASCRERV